MQALQLRKYSLAFAATLPCLIVGCGSTGLTVPVMRPAEVNLSDIEKIAVGDIRGKQGASFSAELTKALFNTGRFDMLDHANLERRLSANNLTLEVFFGGGNQQQVKEVFGATAFISGDITTLDYDEKISKSESSKKDKKTGKETVTRTYTRKGTARMAATLQLVDLRTSQILMIKEFTAKKTKKERSVNDPRPDRIDRSPLFRSCRREMIKAFVRMITPRMESVRVAFETDGKIPLLQQGFGKIRVGNWQAAIDLFRQGTESPQSEVVHKAFYNLGLAYLYTDEFDKSRIAFREAYARKPDKKYVQALRSVDARIAERRRLREQGLLEEGLLDEGSETSP